MQSTVILCVYIIRPYQFLFYLFNIESKYRCACVIDDITKFIAACRDVSSHH